VSRYKLFKVLCCYLVSLVCLVAFVFTEDLKFLAIAIFLDIQGNYENIMQAIKESRND